MSESRCLEKEFNRGSNVKPWGRAHERGCTMSI